LKPELALLASVALVLALTARPQAADTPAAPAGATGVAAATPGDSATSRVDRLEKGDKVEFYIEEDPVRSSGPQELLVLPLGDISFPVSRNSDVVIPVKAAGRAISEVKADLKARLDADYYHDSHIFLKLKEQAPRRGQILFTGQVRTSILNLGASETISLFQAILQVGVSEFANLKKVRVHRTDPATGKREMTIVDVAAMQKGDLSKDMPLRNGDLVEVPERTFIPF
jgi:protein involved in polysaccharide export with SLBB domain